MSRDGYLPPGCTERDVDQSAPDYWDGGPQEDKEVAYFVWSIRNDAEQLMALGAKADLMEAIRNIIDEHKLGSF